MTVCASACDGRRLASPAKLAVSVYCSDGSASAAVATPFASVVAVAMKPPAGQTTLTGLIRGMVPDDRAALLLVWLVDQREGARTERLALDQPQLRRGRPVREEPPAPPHDEGLDQEP